LSAPILGENAAAIVGENLPDAMASETAGSTLCAYHHGYAGSLSSNYPLRIPGFFEWRSSDWSRFDCSVLLHSIGGLHAGAVFEEKNGRVTILD